MPGNQLLNLVGITARRLRKLELNGHFVQQLNGFLFMLQGRKFARSFLKVRIIYFQSIHSHFFQIGDHLPHIQTIL